MNKSRYFAVVFLVAALVASAPAPAASSASDPVAPLGFALGSASHATVMSGLRGKTEIKQHGINKYSLGPMLTAKGNGLGIEGLHEALLIFDKQEVLVAVQLTLSKEFDQGFDRAYGRLAAKYPLVKKSVPFVGNKYARFEKGNVAIELEAPHLSFSMTATYMTKSFEQAFMSMNRKEADEKERKESGKF